MTEQEKQTLQSNLLKSVKPPEGYEVEDYYCFSLLQKKRNRKWSIKLVYDLVNGNSKTSSAIEVEDLDEAIIICRVLQEFAVDKCDAPTSVSIDDLLGKKKW